MKQCAESDAIMLRIHLPYNTVLHMYTLKLIAIIITKSSEEACTK